MATTTSLRVYDYGYVCDSDDSYDDYDDDAFVSPDERTRKLLLSAGMQALEELLAQRGDGGTT